MHMQQYLNGVPLTFDPTVSGRISQSGHAGGQATGNAYNYIYTQNINIMRVCINGKDNGDEPISGKDIILSSSGSHFACVQVVYFPLFYSSEMGIFRSIYYPHLSAVPARHPTVSVRIVSGT
jgi:hypothetical protein